MEKIFEALEEIGSINLGNNPYITFEDNKLKNVYNKEFNGIKQELTDKQDLERFTRLVVEKRVDMNLLAIRHNVETYNDDYYNFHYSYDVVSYLLFEEEFKFVKEMSVKYGKSI